MDNLTIDKYLVPYDFTPVTEEAFHYAHQLAETGGGQVMLLHIVKKKEESKAAELKLSDFVKNLPENLKKTTEYKVMVGNIFEDINKFAQSTSASVIVMGTHGSSGLKKFFGSDAMKVVANSSVPFILTQEHQKKTEINDIVMPFSFQKESVQITHFAASLAEKYDATIHLVGYRGADEWLLRDMKTNQAIVRKHLIQNNVKHNMVTLPGKDSYEKELMDYARVVDADLIAAAYFSQGIRAMFHKFLEEMINNDQKIPIITINAPEVMAVNSGFSFLTI
ncbi:universal stress protein [Paracrocinitomix mangrovi]|uniref:universal stress protein n=1 Tax=Paracrocinitomix mangrovi TaxID=2862509 RepID=UPI001C8E89E0|nr:universal stress protein [Paracrocinitomix mangrovi]UKN02637.1 universal stress protein [Paracrocinitomix mangrovi]